jgi:putative Mg2+ transporter-C (MgtC) family protein
MPALDLGAILRDPQIDALLRVLVAGFVGAVVGLERELAGKPAGVRTYALIAMGAAIFTAGAIAAFGPGDPAARVAAQIVTGIGFIGAGTILHMRDRVVGLTTAAGIWAVAAVGLVIGAGLYVLGVGSAVLLLLLLRFLRTGWLERHGLVDHDDAGDRSPTDDD